MKILLLSDRWFAEGAGGAERMAEQLAREYAGRHDVAVVTTVRQNLREAEKPAADPNTGVKVYQIPVSYPRAARFWRGVWNPAAANHLRRIIRTERPDCVHAHNVHRYFSWSVLETVREEGLPAAVTLHDVMAVSGRRVPGREAEAGSGGVFLAWRNRVIRRYLRQDKVVPVAVSEALRRLLRQRGLDHVRRIRNGIDGDAFQADPGKAMRFRHRFRLEGGKVILLAGRMNRDKGGLELIKALPLVKADTGRARLLIAGRENDFTRLMRKRARRLGVAEQVVFTGWLGAGDLAAAYASCAVAAAPSLCFEAFGMTVLEAMAAGKPVAASCFGGANEVVRDGATGYIVNPRDTGALAGRLTELLADEAKAERFGQAGRRRWEKEFSIGRCAGEYLALFEEMTAQP